MMWPAGSVSKEVLPDLSNLALDVAYDPLTGNVYGCFMDEKGYEARFGFIDYTTHKVTEICRLDVLYFAMFATRMVGSTPLPMTVIFINSTRKPENGPKLVRPESS